MTYSIRQDIGDCRGLDERVLEAIFESVESFAFRRKQQLLEFFEVTVRVWSCRGAAFVRVRHGLAPVMKQVLSVMSRLWLPVDRIVCAKSHVLVHIRPFLWAHVHHFPRVWVRSPLNDCADFSNNSASTARVTFSRRNSAKAASMAFESSWFFFCISVDRVCS